MKKDMKKELDNLRIEPYGICFTKNIRGSQINCSITSIDSSEINGSFECTDKELESLINTTKNVFKNMPELDKKAKELIKINYPDEDNNLPLDDIIFYDNHEFSLGYDAGESVAGPLYIYVKFNKDFTRKKELIYEIY